MLSAVFAALATVPEPPVAPTTPPPATEPAVTEPATTEPPFVDPDVVGEDSIASTVADVIGAAVDNLLENGYQTGTAVLVAAVALIAMRSLKINAFAQAVVAIGAFWVGWITFDLFDASDNPLFPTDVQADDFLDVAFGGPTGFLVAAIVASIAGYFLWRKELKPLTRIFLMLGALFSASFVYNLVEAVRQARAA